MSTIFTDDVFGCDGKVTSRFFLKWLRFVAEINVVFALRGAMPIIVGFICMNLYYENSFSYLKWYITNFIRPDPHVWNINKSDLNSFQNYLYCLLALRRPEISMTKWIKIIRLVNKYVLRSKFLRTKEKRRTWKLIVNI